MYDLLQVVVVTVVAALALGVLVGPYLRRSSPETPACAHCPGARRHRQPDVRQPLTFVFPTKPR